MTASKHTYPDMIASAPNEDWAYAFAKRDTFRVDERVFVRDGADAYTDGKIVVFHDQQDSTSWAARPAAAELRGVVTSYFWTPEYAVAKLLDVAEAVI